MAQRAPVQRAAAPCGVARVAVAPRIVLSPTMRRQGAGVTRGRFGVAGATIWVLHVGRLTLPGTQLPTSGFPSAPERMRGGAG